MANEIKEHACNLLLIIVGIIEESKTARKEDLVCCWLMTLLRSFQERFSHLWGGWWLSS